MQTSKGPYKYLLTSGATTLLIFCLVFVFFPAILVWKGFVYMFGTIIFAVGIQPHVKRLTQEGHQLNFALQVPYPVFNPSFGWSYWEQAQDKTCFLGQSFVKRLLVGVLATIIAPFFMFKVKRRRFEQACNLRVRSEKMANTIVSWGLVISAIATLPILALILQQQGLLFAAKVGMHEVEIREGLNAGLVLARETAPSFVPSGDISGVLAGASGQILGDAKHLILTVTRQALLVSGVILKDWILLCISAILVGVILNNWEKERDFLKGVLSDGISDEGFRDSLIRFFELFQLGLSTLLIGFLEVAATLSLIYVFATIIFPFNLSLGAIILISLTLGFITAVWKIGGAFAMVVGAGLLIMDFHEGLGWFGFTVVSIGIFGDVLIKVIAITLIAKVLGFFEAYNYTPVIIGAKLRLTKMTMVFTILVWALGGGFFYMIGGVLLMLAYQASQSLTNEKKAAQASSLLP